MRLALILLSFCSHTESWADDLPDVACDSGPLAAAYCECGIELAATRTERDGARAVVVEREAERDGLKLELAGCRAGWTQERQAHALTRAKAPAERRTALVLGLTGGAVAGVVLGYGLGTLAGRAR